MQALSGTFRSIPVDKHRDSERKATLKLGHETISPNSYQNPQAAKIHTQPHPNDLVAKGMVALSNQNKAFMNPVLQITRLTFGSGSIPKTETVQGDQGSCPFGPHFQKYWDKLHWISRNHYKDMRFNAETLLSIKPIQYFYHLGQTLPASIRTIIDPFCGGGGATIGFAKAGKEVYASDIEQQHVDIAKHNANVFSLDDDIEFKRANALDIINTAKADCIYLDPPWGGFDRKRGEPFRLKHLGAFGQNMLTSALQRFNHILLSIPKDIDLNEFSSFGRDFSVFNGTIGGKTEFTTVYFHPMQN